MTEVEKILAEAAEKIRKEAYFAGWNDCLASVKEAMESVVPDTEAGAGYESAGSESKPNRVNGDAKGPKMGTTPFYALMAVRKTPGMTGAEVVAAVHENGHNVADPNIRISLSRLAEKGLVVNRHRKWFPE